MKLLSLFVVVEFVRPAVENFVYFRTDGVADLLLEPQVHFARGDHGFCILFLILYGLPANQLADSHHTAYQGAARLPSSGYPSRQRTRRLKGSHILQI